MVKIIILHPHIAYYGGASKYLLEVASRLVERGWEVLIVTTVANREIIDEYPNLKIIQLGDTTTGKLKFWLKYPIFQFRLNRLLNHYPQKILFPQIFPSIWWASIYKKFHPETPVFWMCHEPSAFIHSPLVVEGLRQPNRTILKFGKSLFEFLDLYLVKEADFLIANSKYGAGLIKKIYGRKADIIAYPAVDSTRFKPGKQKQNYIFTVSRLDKQKNLDILLKAFSLLPNKLKDKYKVIIAGEGTEKENLKNLSLKLGIVDQIKFLGWVKEKDLPKLYAKSKLVIFCAKDEPFGMVTVEAMASGSPVIAAKSGGTMESIINGENGILVKPQDAKVLAKKMEEILTSQKTSEMIIDNALKYVKEKFNWEQTVDKIETLLSKGPPRQKKEKRFSPGQLLMGLALLGLLVWNTIFASNLIKEGLAVIKFRLEKKWPTSHARLCYQIGYSLCAYYDFIKNHTPKDAKILVPPQGYPWPATGNIAYSRYFLYPRYLFNGGEKEAKIDLKKREIEYVLIDWGETNYEYGFTNGWPKFFLPAKKIIFEDGTVIQDDYEPAKFLNLEKRGIIELDRERL